MKRRSLFKAGAAFAVAAATPLLPKGVEAAPRPQNDEAAGTLDRAWRQNTAPNQRLLLQGGAGGPSSISGAAWPLQATFSVPFPRLRGAQSSAYRITWTLARW